jgi:uncharacterized protein YjbI with pentapeptide repeats
MADEPEQDNKPLQKPVGWSELAIGAYRWYARPLIATDWFFRWAAYYLSISGIIAFLGYLGKLSIVVAAISYALDAPERKKKAHYDAWAVIISNEGKRGDGGRIEALESLNKDGINLSGVDLHKAYLGKIRLSGATLNDANLSEALLRDADLSGTELNRADFHGAQLVVTNLQKANLRRAQLQGAYMAGANLRDAHFDDANLEDADLTGAGATGADFTRAFFSAKTTFGPGTDLRGADLRGAIGLIKGQLDLTQGNEETKTSEGFPRPESWGGSTAISKAGRQ